MSNSRWFGLVGLVLALGAKPAFAQKVVVLEFDGDKQDRLRNQVETALTIADVVKVVPLDTYREAASRRKLKGQAAMTAAAVGKLSVALGLDAAVEGTVTDNFQVRILDSTGQELWSKELPVKAGVILAEHAKKLAKAVAVAAKTAAGKAGTGAAESGEEAARGHGKRGGEGGDEQGGSESGRTEESRAGGSDANPDVDPDMLGRKPGPRAGPKILTVTAAGSTVWRSYCSRPGGAVAGVNSCNDYDAKFAKDPTNVPKGDTVKFSPEVPYAGAVIAVELFPLVAVPKAGIGSGLGLTGTYGRGWSLTNVRVQTPSWDTPEKQVVSVDDALTASAVFRYFFSYGDRADPLVGYGGLRAGYEMRTFEVDPTANVPLPGSHRGYPSVGIDVSVPLAKLVRIQLSGSYFLNPKAGQDEIAGYGNPSAFEGGAFGRGFSVEGGLTGTIYGPLGYSVRYRLVSYSDIFYGQGQKWPCDDTQCGGVAEETYSGLTWGLSATF